MCQFLLFIHVLRLNFAVFVASFLWCCYNKYELSKQQMMLSRVHKMTVKQALFTQRHRLELLLL